MKRLGVTQTLVKNPKKYLDLARELKKAIKHEGDVDNNYNLCTWSNRQIIGKEPGRLKISGQVKTIQTTILLRSA